MPQTMTRNPMAEALTPARKDRIDALGAVLLIAVSANLGLNQVLVKMVNAGMSPLFQAGMRSACAILPIVLYMAWRGKSLRLPLSLLPLGIVCGAIFAGEFALLFAALERTTVGRSSVLFYTMPVWVAVAAHFLIPGETMTRSRALGLVLAVAGVAVALLGATGFGGLFGGNHAGSPAGDNWRMLSGDLMALAAATGWATIALVLRLTAMGRQSAEMQLLVQLVFSAPILLGLAWVGGDMFRDMSPLLWGAFAWQVIGVVAIGFTVWFWVLSIYPASDMASYAFLSPLFGVLFGWLIIGEQLTPTIVIALALVGAGIWLVNRR